MAAVIHTTKLARVVEYAPGDQVITVEAGITLGALQERLAEQRQRVSLDAPWPSRSTLGGIIATNSFGPLRARSGSIRDLILGISLVRADGVLARGGGKVVKNVAGFDLPKLACGSLGTLALIAACTLRVHPLPEATEERVIRDLSAADVVAVMLALRAAQLEPSALLARRRGAGWSLALRFEGFGPAVAQQVAKLGAVRDHDEDGGSFAEHQAARENARLRLKIAALPNQLVAVERALATLLVGDAELAWYPTLGLGFVTSGATELTGITEARAALRALGGSLTLEEAPAESLRETWTAPSSIALHRAVKARFDPQGLLAPGRFVGGI